MNLFEEKKEIKRLGNGRFATEIQHLKCKLLGLQNMVEYYRGLYLCLGRQNSQLIRENNELKLKLKQYGQKI